MGWGNIADGHMDLSVDDSELGEIFGYRMGTCVKIVNDDFHAGVDSEQ